MPDDLVRPSPFRAVTPIRSDDFASVAGTPSRHMPFCRRGAQTNTRPAVGAVTHPVDGLAAPDRTVQCRRGVYSRVPIPATASAARDPPGVEDGQDDGGGGAQDADEDVCGTTARFSRTAAGTASASVSAQARLQSTARAADENGAYLVGGARVSAPERTFMRSSSGSRSRSSRLHSPRQIGTRTPPIAGFGARATHSQVDLLEGGCRMCYARKYGQAHFRLD